MSNLTLIVSKITTFCVRYWLSCCTVSPPTSLWPSVFCKFSILLSLYYISVIFVGLKAKFSTNTVVKVCRQATCIKDHCVKLIWLLANTQSNISIYLELCFWPPDKCKSNIKSPFALLKNIWLFSLLHAS